MRKKLHPKRNGPVSSSIDNPVTFSTSMMPWTFDLDVFDHHQHCYIEWTPTPLFK
jgi:hypothetical protein